MTSISDSFQILIDRIQPLQSEIDAADRHLTEIKSRLEKAFTVKSFLVVGSASRNTFIHGYSDVDLFAVVARNDLRWGGNYVSSETVLNNFRKELEGRFWNSNVYRDIHAIVVAFTDSQVDVVPAFFAGPNPNGWPLYSIPDGARGWMTTSPGYHNAYLKQKNEESRGKLRCTAQLLKFWRACRSPSVPLSSFHIEMVLAHERLCVGARSYATCVTEIFQNLASRECRGIHDPLGVSGIVPAVKSESQRLNALTSIRYSREHAKAAYTADYHGNLHEARRQWDIVFNNQFPW
ncbi:MAG: nucleotidyltransferase domain-containing protein [Acidobacteriota bacterium]